MEDCTLAATDGKIYKYDVRNDSFISYKILTEQEIDDSEFERYFAQTGDMDKALKYQQQAKKERNSEQNRAI